MTARPQSEEPTSLASPTLGPAKCVTTDTTNYAAVGWFGPRIVVLADHFVGCDEFHYRLLSALPNDPSWRSEATIDMAVSDYQIASNGDSVIVPAAAGVVVISSDGRVKTVSRPKGAPDWWGGNGFRLTNGRAYLVVGAPQLDVIAPDGGSMSTHPLPAGYVAVAPTSDADEFILAPLDDSRLPAGLLGTPFRAYLWSSKTQALKLVASVATAVLPASSSLAVLRLENGDAVALASTGQTTPVALKGIDWWRSPDGSLYLSAPRPYERDIQTYELRETATDRVVASFSGSIGTPVWHGQTMAVVSGGGDLASEIVLIERGAVTKLALP